MRNLLGFTGIIGIIMLTFGNAGSIGYGLYLWGGTGVAFGLAAWTAFKVWMIVVGAGLGFFLSAFLSKK